MTDSPSTPDPAPAAANLLRLAAPDIAHDLNNLRAVAQGNLRLARQDAGSSGREALSESLADVDMALQLMVAQFQGVVGLLGGAPTRSPPPGSLAAVLRRVETLARWALPPQFGIALPAEPPALMVPADPELLQAALLRLVLLARDAAPGGGEVEISVSEKPGDDAARTRNPSGVAAGRHARICVQLPGNMPGAGAAGDSPAAGKFALRFELALALARRALAPSGDVIHGNGAGGRGFVCLLLPLG